MKDQEYTFKEFGRESVPTFPYEEYGILGFGKNQIPIKSMDEYIDHSQDEELHVECCKGLALSKGLQIGRTGGSFIPEEMKNFQNSNSWSEILHNIEERDPKGIHRKTLEFLANSLPTEEAQYALFKYSVFALGAPVPWFFILNLKKNDFHQKNLDDGKWTVNIMHFPKLKKYIETLPFKFIGRVVIFVSYPNSPVLTHRDAVIAEHKDHNINLFLAGGDRPSFVWDEVKKEKVYLSPGSRSYFFNNRDYHGVDPQPMVRYTIRIDGVFEDWLCEELGLEDQYVWKWDYLKK